MTHSWTLERLTKACQKGGARRGGRARLQSQGDLLSRPVFGGRESKFAGRREAERRSAYDEQTDDGKRDVTHGWTGERLTKACQKGGGQEGRAGQATVVGGPALETCLGGR